MFHSLLHALQHFHDAEQSMPNGLKKILGITEMEVTDEAFRINCFVNFDQA